MHSNQPFTLAPSTLKYQMILTLPFELQNTLFRPDNSFITKVCLTTYTYRSSCVENACSSVANQTMVILNSLTEERKCLHKRIPMITGITFSRAPDLVIAMFPTTYHYFNTINKGQQEQPPFVVSSKYTIINTMTLPAHFVNVLHLSKVSSPITNTYISQVLFIKIVFDEVHTPRHVTSTNNLTQVVITESLQTTISYDINTKITNLPFLSEKEIISSASIIEKEQSKYVLTYSTKSLMETVTFSTTNLHKSLTEMSSYISILKQLCQNDSKVPTHQLKLQIFVIQNIVTHTVGSSLLNTNILLSLNSELMLKQKRIEPQTIVKMASLSAGGNIQVTAMNIFKDLNSNYIPSCLQESPNSISANSRNNYQKNNSNLILPNSENFTTYIKSNDKYSSRIVLHSSIIEKFNVKCFRPIINVVSQILKKQLVHTQTALTNKSTYIKKNLKPNILQRQTISKSRVNPVYIPLEQNEYNKLKKNNLYPSDSEQWTHDFLRNLIFNKISLYLPKHTLTNILSTGDDVNTSKVYRNEFIYSGISIKPGEVITARNNVIFGRPNIDMKVSQTLLSGNISTSSSHQLTSQKPLHSTISFFSKSIHNSHSNKERIMIKYGNILKPPPLTVNHQLLQQHSSTIQIKIRKPPVTIRFSSYVRLKKSSSIGIYSSQSIIRLNTAFYKNQILNIFQTPQIFGLSLPSAKGETVSNRSDFYFINNISPVSLQHTFLHKIPIIVSTYGALQQVKLKNNVSRHTINMHGRPLTFNKEFVNDPHETTVRGQIELMPYITVSMNDDRMDVQLTHRRVVHEHLDPASTKFKLESIKLRNGQHSFYFENTKTKVIFNHPIIYTNKSFSQSTFSQDNSDKSNSKTTRHIIGILNKKLKPFIDSCQKEEHSNKSSLLLKSNNYQEYDFSSKKRFSVIRHITDVTKPESTKEHNHIEKSNTLKLPLTDIHALKISFKYFIASPQYNSVTPFTNPRPISLMSIFRTSGIKCNKDCTNIILKEKKYSFKMLNPSEISLDDINSVSKKNVVWEAISGALINTKKCNPSTYASIYSRETPDYFNILKPTKTKYINLINVSEIGIICDRNNFTYNNYSFLNTPKKYIKIPLSIAIQKILTSSRMNTQSQEVLESVVISKLFSKLKTSSFLANQFKVTSGFSSSTTVNFTEKKNGSTSNHKFIGDEISLYPTSDSKSSLHNIILEESPSKTKKNTVDACHPPCKLNNNEICVTFANNTGSLNSCECRPSFGRMFLDRPCKPSFTYEMKVQAASSRNHTFKRNNKMKRILLEAANRIIMESDYRDIFHGVQIRNVFADKNDTLLITFLLQLSENLDVDQLTSEFKNYFRRNNSRIGTGLFMSKNGLHLQSLRDFDECVDHNFNDCSINAHCLNLIGSYTCSCKTGYKDISDNDLYPGRNCSDNINRCAKCNYNGKCISESIHKGQLAITVCKCHSWYGGTKCQVNKKIIIIFIFTTGTVIFMLLLSFIALMKIKHKLWAREKKSTFFISASTLYPSTITPTNVGGPLNCGNGSINELSLRITSIDKKKSNDLRNHHFKPILLRKTSAIKNYKTPSALYVNGDLNIKYAIGKIAFINKRINNSPYNDDETDRSVSFLIPRVKLYVPNISQESFSANYSNRSIKDIKNEMVVDDAIDVAKTFHHTQIKHYLRNYKVYD
ncbi:uncharacterized protein LOC108108683 isoform X3 [Drosophila eugracilis]|uniref:uncharacterized protein LOC108108683 isoform X3 n=1 Tax=Drosophila eugracilis TaxID=29029 RepID=UPI001BD97F7D|nr:uncharacterized protein LOC108108683 isoform X3 [Drosophila eugracilis]